MWHLLGSGSSCTTQSEGSPIAIFGYDAAQIPGRAVYQGHNRDASLADLLLPSLRNCLGRQRL